MNSRPIAESQLVFNTEGAIYHLNLFPDMLADNIILVGDPDRVPEVSKHFDDMSKPGNNNTHRHLQRETYFCYLNGNGY